MSDSQKPREFWIYEVTIDDRKTCHLVAKNDKPLPGNTHIHVIEHSAYVELKQQSLAMREALEWYASPPLPKDKGTRGDIYNKYNLQRRAVQALEQFDEFIKRTEK